LLKYEKKSFLLEVMLHCYFFLKDSGRSADLVAELYACYTDNENGGGNVHPPRPQTGAHRDNEINGM